MKTSEPSQNTISLWLTVTGLAVLIILMLMVLFSALGSPSGENAISQLTFLRRNMENGGHNLILFQLGFVFASILPITTLPLQTVIALFVPFGTNQITNPARIIGVLFTAAYFPLSTVAYASQYTIVPMLLRDQGPDATKLWYFSSPNSIPFTMDLLAYAILGVGAILISIGLVYQQGVWRWGGIAMLLSGITSIIAFGLHTIESTASIPISLISAVFYVPVPIVAIIYARQLTVR